MGITKLIAPPPINLLHKHVELANLINSHFSRNSDAYLSNGVKVSPNMPRFEAGKFGQAVLIEEETTNLLTANQSSVETDTSGFQPSTGATISRDTSKAWNGSASLKVVTDGSAANQGVMTSLVNISPSTTYTYSVYLTGSGTVRLIVYYYDSGGSYISTDFGPSISLNQNWQRGIMTFTTPSNAASVRLRVETLTAQDITFWADGLQLEQKPYATSWTLGGTTRAAETLTVPTAGVLSPTEGTVEVWVYWPDFLSANVSSWRRIWGVRTTAGPGMFVCHWNPNPTEPNKLFFALYSDSGTRYEVGADMPSVGWHKIDCVWSSSRMALFIDGVKVAERTDHVLPTVLGDSTIHIGARHDDEDHLNTIIGPVRFSNIARSDAEIATTYRSGQPLLWDEHTTALFTFDGVIDTKPYVICPNGNMVYNVALCTTTDITYYVSPSGNDANDGLTPATPFRTIQRAINVLPKIIDHNVTIQLADGTYDEVVNIKGFAGKGELTIIGNPASRTNVKVRGFDIRCNTFQVVIQHLEVNCTGTPAIRINHHGSLVVVEYVTIQSGASIGIDVSGAKAVVRYCTISNCTDVAILSLHVSHVLSRENTGSGNNNVLKAGAGGVIAIDGTQPSGTVDTIVWAGGVVR